MHQLDLFIKRLFFTSLLLFAAEFPSWAQTVYPETMPQRGISPNGSYSFDKNESINKLNGILTYTIPLTTMPLGRAGMSIPINLAYSSALYDYSYRQTLNGSTPVIVRDIVGSPWGGWSF